VHNLLPLVLLASRRLLARRVAELHDRPDDRQHRKAGEVAVHEPGQVRAVRHLGGEVEYVGEAVGRRDQLAHTVDGNKGADDGSGDDDDDAHEQQREDGADDADHRAENPERNAWVDRDLVAKCSVAKDRGHDTRSCAHQRHADFGFYQSQNADEESDATPHTQTDPWRVW
jgi:hypothetical protein